MLAERESLTVKLLRNCPSLEPLLPLVSGQAPLTHTQRLCHSHRPLHPLLVFENNLLRGTGAGRSQWPREVSALPQVTQEGIDGAKTAKQVWSIQVTAVSQIPQFSQEQSSVRS